MSALLAGVRYAAPGRAAVPLPSALTRAASTQTYLTIRFLVERARRDSAFRAYAYFRWVDDVLDAGDRGSPEEAREQRLHFVARQHAIVEACLGGQVPSNVERHEAMLVELLRHRGETSNGLEIYVRHMMRVMKFDARRRGSLVSAVELDEYTSWLASAVTEAMHHFLGDGNYEPHDTTRYQAVRGAHILHMLRDTRVDLGLGYVNVPGEFLRANGIGPADIDSEAYRGWVHDRADLARECLRIGRTFFEHVEGWRFRLAGLAYIARFEWLLDRLENDGFTIQPSYAHRVKLADGLRVGWGAVSHPRLRFRRAAMP